MRLSQRSFSIGALAVYPFLFLAPVFFGSDGLRLGNQFSDMNGTLAGINELNAMSTPWSATQWFGFPEFQGYWDLMRVSQAFHSLGFWFLTRIFEPYDSLNIYIFAGWVCTGLISFLIAREFSFSYPTAVGYGILVQSLPWIREKATEHVSYVWLAVPLAVVLFCIRVLKNPSQKNIIWLVALLLCSAFFDIYWFQFSLVSVLITMFVFSIVLFRNKSRILASAIILGLTISLAVLYFFVPVIYQHIELASNSTNPGRFKIVSNEILSSFSADPVDYLNRNPLKPTFVSNYFDAGHGSDNVFYVGLSVLFFATTGVVALIKKGFTAIHSLALTLLIAFFLLSLGRFNLGIIEVPPLNQIARNFLIGVRVYLRSGLIAQCLLALFALEGISVFIRMISRRQIRTIFVLATISVLALDLSPMGGRQIYRESEKFDNFIQIIDSAQSVSLLNSNPEIFWNTEFLDAPLLNTDDASWMVKTYPSAAKGSQALAEFLNQLGVKYVVAPINDEGQAEMTGFIQDSVMFRTQLNPRDFLQMGSDVRSVEGSNRSVRLLQVRTGGTTQLCRSCALAQARFVPQLDLSSEGLPFDQHLVLWSHSDITSIFPETFNDLNSNGFNLHFSVIAPLGPWATSQILEIKVGDYRQLLEVNPGEPVDVSLTIESDEHVEISSLLPCFVPKQVVPNNTDERQFCFGLARFLVETI
jgi:hypothetical protein